MSLLAGIDTTMVAITTGSAVGFFAGTAVAGVGFGAGFQRSMRRVIPLAAPHERSAALSIIYVVSYLAMGPPAVLGGVLVVYGGGLRITAGEYGGRVRRSSTAVEYGAVVMLLAGTALAGSLLTARQSAAPWPGGWSRRRWRRRRRGRTLRSCAWPPSTTA